MAPRSRFRYKTVLVGSHTRPPLAPYSNTVYNDIEQMDDSVLPGNGHAMSLARSYFTGSFPVCNGTYQRSGVTHVVTNYPPGLINSNEFLSTTRVLPGGIPTLLQASAEIAKVTNPSRPLVDLPVFIVELRDLPNLLLRRSQDIGADIARGRLSVEYGWKPLLKDIKALFGFKKAFDDRVREIHALRESGIRRKRIIFNGSTSSAPIARTYTNNVGLVLSGTTQSTTTAKVTGFVKWVPDKDIPRHLLLRNDLAEQKALFALLGLNPFVIDASTIWEVIPYSWLVDWCSNWGDLLAAERNIVGAHIEEILIMRHYVTEQKCTVSMDSSETAVKNGVKLSKKEVTRYYETKSREVGSLELEAHMPFLSIRQISILADIVRSNTSKRK
jgi:hypothetical protein